MFSKKYGRYAVVAVFLIGWIQLIDVQTRNAPQARRVTVENHGAYSLVKCELWNPTSEPVHVEAHLRLYDEGDPESGIGFSSCPATIVRRRIEPWSHVALEQPIKCLGNYSHAEVRLFVITNANEITETAISQQIQSLDVSMARTNSANR